MRLNFCVACGANNTKLHHHHMVPRVLGGPDTADNMLTLCEPCHVKMHTMQEKGLLHMDTLVEIGRMLAVADGRLTNTAGANISSTSAHDLAQARAEECRDVVEDYIAEAGASATMKALGRQLERNGLMTPQGKPNWSNTAVYNLVGRLGIDWVRAKQTAKAADRKSAKQRNEERLKEIATKRAEAKPIYTEFVNDYTALAGQAPPISLILARLNEQLPQKWSRGQLQSAMRQWAAEG